MDKKPSTSDILAQIRKQKEAAAAKPVSEAGEPTAEAPKSAEKPAGAAPKGTSSILDSIRASKGGAAGAAKSGGSEPAPAKGGAAPKGTSSILDSIRGGGAAKGGAAPKKEVSASTAKAVVAPAGNKPSVAEMVKAVREGTKLEVKATPKLAPKLPGRAPAPKAGAKATPSRRAVLAPIVALFATPFALAWWVFGAINGILALYTAKFMMPNMVLALPSRFKVGVVSDFPSGGVSEKYKASRGIWIVNTEFNGQQQIYALASVCTHLGCTPNWLEGEQKYKCPCHGSGFYKSGINFEGPAPRPLERVGLRVAEDGQLEVDKSLKFQEELGQWGDPKSFVPMV